MQLNVDSATAAALVETLFHYHTNSEVIDKAYNDLRELIRIAKLNKIDSHRAKEFFEQDDAMRGALEDFVGVLGYEDYSNNVAAGRSGFEAAKIFMAQYVRIKNMCSEIRNAEVTIARWEIRSQIIENET